MKGEMEPVVCELKYSGAISLALAAAAFATVGVVAVLPWSLALKASIALCVCGLALRSARSTRAVRSLRVDGDATVTVRLEPGGEIQGRLREPSFVAPWLTIVRWRARHGRFDRTVLVLPMMADAAQFRRLRILLRWA